MNEMLQEKTAETEQKLIDTDTEKLKIMVDRDRAESEAKTLEEKLTGANATIAEEKNKMEELTKREEDLKAEKEDLENQVGVLTEEREIARKAEEELWDNLNAREEELMNTNDGYCHLTEQNHEMREDFEENLEQRDSMIETLNTRNQELADEGMTLRKEIGEWKRKLIDAEKAVQRGEQGLPVNYRVTMVPALPQGMLAALSAGGAPSPAKKEDATKRKKKDKCDYEEDFDES